MSGPLMWITIGILALAYLVGAIPFANIVAHVAAGVDLRDVGSHTSGESNLFSVAGFPAMAIAGIGDVGKGAVGPGVAIWLNQPPAVSVLAGALAVIGHNWSVFHHWAGGRGLSAAMGVGLVLAWPATVLIALGMIIGRLLRATAPGSFVALLLLVPVLWLTYGGYGTAVGVALLVPTIVKRILGNELPSRWSREVLVSRLVHDRDPDASANPGASTGPNEPTDTGQSTG